MICIHDYAAKMLLFFGIAKLLSEKPSKSELLHLIYHIKGTFLGRFVCVIQLFSISLHTPNEAEQLTCRNPDADLFRATTLSIYVLFAENTLSLHQQK